VFVVEIFNNWCESARCSLGVTPSLDENRWGGSVQVAVNERDLLNSGC
jgi:hypothetical protein